MTAPKSFVVKVQLSLFSDLKHRQVLIYNRTQSVLWQGNADKRALTLMAGRPKAFFRAHMDGTVIVLDRETSDKDW